MLYAKLFEAWCTRYRKAAALDGYRWIRRETMAMGLAPAEGDDGSGLVEATVGTLTVILCLRGLDFRRSAKEFNHIRRFLALQDYGRSSAQNGVTLSVGFYAHSLMAGIAKRSAVLIRVSELRDVDLEDLREAVNFDHLTVQSHVEPMTLELGDELGLAIHEDLTFDDEDLPTEYWVDEDGNLQFGIYSESDDES
ncbi:MAG: hypothetical protein IV100_10735 [Myxococcales bacterium]|nr:hypothetical protein [Myxococcales bacterium]